MFGVSGAMDIRKEIADGVKRKYTFRFKIYNELRVLHDDVRIYVFGYRDIKDIIKNFSSKDIKNKIDEFEKSIGCYVDEVELLRELYTLSEDEIIHLSGHCCESVEDLVTKNSFEELSTLMVVRKKLKDDLLEGTVIECDHMEYVVIKADNTLVTVMDSKMQFRVLNLLHDKIKTTNKRININEIKNIASMLD